MRRKVGDFMLIALMAASVVCGGGKVHAYCVGWDKTLPNYDPHYYSVPKEFRRAKYVVEVQVLRETWLGEDGVPKPLDPPFQFGGKRPWGLDPYIGAYYEVRVLKSFKGEAPVELRLFSENSTARFWFDIGSKQVLFLTDGKFDPPVSQSLTVDTCGNSRPLRDARLLLSTLRKLDPNTGQGRH